ncbi:hypothetical protein DVH24_008965 [Malus domestica]|uniref:COBRA C-terminal domain-containing protein n=1 Tax=Malus domestica TaxID=3750 RepID=A0A498JTH3_MALDO|nr:hypothetical protein DVH24_008965 [Malus domestica]
MLASQNPTSCILLPSFYNPMIIPCLSCACGCKHKKNCAAVSSNTSVEKKCINLTM